VPDENKLVHGSGVCLFYASFATSHPVSNTLIISSQVEWMRDDGYTTVHKVRMGRRYEVLQSSRVYHCFVRS
jgi:hypothetical protein